ncbi:MAG: tail fiber domain-containing protein [Wenzhouxiangella sp.]
MRKLMILLPLMWLATAVTAAPMTYQGQLQDGSGPYSGTASMSFRLYDSLSGGNTVGPLVSQSNVSVSDGLFQVELDFGEVFDGSSLFLEVAVEGTALAPRQPITAAPMAQFAMTPAGPEGPQGPQGPEGPQGPAGDSVWAQTGDAIEYLANNQTMAFFPDSNAENGPNIVMGHADNAASGSGATVSGGGSAMDPNVAGEISATVGGGRGNTAGAPGATIAGGFRNSAGVGATVAGGSLNWASAPGSSIGGGTDNLINGSRATISGGRENIASAWHATVGGGAFNHAGGLAASIPGGESNEALGDYSFAAGRHARVQSDHGGTFIWADSREAAFESTAPDQFLIAADGGVGINTNEPEHALDVDGIIHSSVALTTDGQGFFGSTVFVGSLGSLPGDQELCRASVNGRLAPCSSSSLRYKNEIEDYGLAWEQFLALRPVSYRFIENGQPDIGLIAEELAEVDERLVVFDEQGRPDSIRYGRLSVVLLAALQAREKASQAALEAQAKHNESMQASMAVLEAENDRLEDRLARLEALLVNGTQLSEVTQ